MIVYLSDYLSQYIPSLRVVSYLTFRAVMSLFTDSFKENRYSYHGRCADCKCHCHFHVTLV